MVPSTLPLLFFWRHHQDFSSSIQALSHPGNLALALRSTSPSACGQTPEPVPAGTGDFFFNPDIQDVKRLKGKERGCCCWSTHHHREDDSGRRRLDNPEQHQTGELGDSEQVHLPQRDVAQVDEVRLVLCWHAEQLQTVKELRQRWRRTQVARKLEGNERN